VLELAGDCNDINKYKDLGELSTGLYTGQVKVTYQDDEISTPTITLLFGLCSSHIVVLLITLVIILCRFSYPVLSRSRDRWGEGKEFLFNYYI
jgi:hypothetical protein